MTPLLRVRGSFATPKAYTPTSHDDQRDDSAPERRFQPTQGRLDEQQDDQSRQDTDDTQCTF